MQDIRVAAVIMRSVVGKTQDNISRMESFVQQAADQGANVVCFPEMSITGYSTRETIRKYAEPIPGPSTEAVARIARENHIVVLAGLLEMIEGNSLTISQIVVSPDGLMGIYRKLHLGPPEQDLYKPGDELPIFRYRGVAFGIELCYDAHFPELSTLLALKGAEVLFVPYASPRGSPEEKYNSWLRYLSARAYDNSVFVVTCNQVGDSGAGLTFPGVAFIFDPKGQVVAEKKGEDEGMIVADLRSEDFTYVRSHRMRFFLPQRRPELYGELVNPKHTHSK